MIRRGEKVRAFRPDVKFEWVASSDVGRVIGEMLAGGLKAANGEETILIVGPECCRLGRQLGLLGM